MKNERQHGEKQDEAWLREREPISMKHAGHCFVASVALILLAVLIAFAARAEPRDPLDSLDFVSPPPNTSTVQKWHRPRGVMKDVPEVLEALKSKARRWEV